MQGLPVPFLIMGQDGFPSSTDITVMSQRRCGINRRRMRQAAIGGITMKRTPKCYNEEEFELDNIYNDDDDRYGKEGLSAMFY